MADINELEKRIAKLEENLNKVVNIVIEASENRKQASEIVPPHMSAPTSADYLVNDVDESDDVAADLSALMVGADNEKAQKMAIQASLVQKLHGN